MSCQKCQQPIETQKVGLAVADDALGFLNFDDKKYSYHGYKSTDMVFCCEGCSLFFRLEGRHIFKGRLITKLRDRDDVFLLDFKKFAIEYYSAQLTGGFKVIKRAL